MTTEERLEKLERELARAKRINRWVLAAMGLALGACMLAVGLGASPPAVQGGGAALKEIRANRFVVEDEKGAVRAVLEAEDREDWADERAYKGKDNPFLEKAAPALHLYDDKGRVRASLRLSKSGPLLCLMVYRGTQYHLPQRPQDERRRGVSWRVGCRPSPGPFGCAPFDRLTVRASRGQGRRGGTPSRNPVRVMSIGSASRWPNWTCAASGSSRPRFWLN